MIDWTKAPEWANYAAMHENGIWWWFGYEPELSTNVWLPVDAEHAGKIGKYVSFEAGCFQGDWKDSLQERPADDKQYIPKERSQDYEAGIESVRLHFEAHLRDQFEMAALTGLCANSNLISKQDMIEISDGTKGGKHVIGAAKILADAMMKEREK